MQDDEEDEDYQYDDVEATFEKFQSKIKSMEDAMTGCY